MRIRHREPRIEIRKGRTGQFRFVVIAENGEPLATSELYTTKAKCRKGIKALTETVLGVHTAVTDTTDTR